LRKEHGYVPARIAIKIFMNHATQTIAREVVVDDSSWANLHNYIKNIMIDSILKYKYYY